MLGFKAYFDDSGSDDGSPFVTIGGPIFSRIQAKAMSTRWLRALKRNRIEPPLHMADFLGMGKHSSMYPEFKRCMFLALSAIINEHKLCSLSICVSQEEFKGELDKDIRESLIGPYALAFFSAVVLVQSVTKRTGVGRIAYMVDRGSANADQLTAAHKVIIDIEKRLGDRYTGALGFDSDDLIPPLQAADLIAWSARRRQLDGSLPIGFEPLNEVLREDIIPGHGHLQLPTHGIRMVADPINQWISKRGTMPNLKDIIRP